MFRDIPHLMCPVVTEMGKAASILEWAVTKMDERYELLAEVGVRDLSSYNDLGWDEIKERMNPATPAEEARIPKKLPFIVFVIDELADLMMTNKEVEDHIVRIAQKARAVGIHLILATQRPQANVVTGLIKSNMPCRISFKVSSGMDSRIVLDQKGAELLLGHGDMMYISPRSSEIVRAQGTLVDDHEIRNSVKFLKTISKQSFEPSLVQIKTEGFEAENKERDPLFDKAVRVVLETRRGSVSLLQRRPNHRLLPSFKTHRRNGKRRITRRLQRLTSPRSNHVNRRIRRNHGTSTNRRSKWLRSRPTSRQRPRPRRRNATRTIFNRQRFRLKSNG